MRALLKLKSWQLFIVLFTPFLLSGSIPYGLPDTYPYISNLWIVFYLIWLNAIGLELHNQIGTKQQNKIWIVILQFLILISIISSVLIPISTLLPMSSLIKTIVYISSIVGPLLSITFCTRYLAIVEEKKNSVLLNFILLWFFPIGLWLIQPKLRVLVKTEAAL